MPDSRYAPPRAAVADAEPAQAALPRPARMIMALRLLWAAYAIDVLTGLWVAMTAHWAPGALIGGIVGTAVGAILNAWFYVAIGRGRNWARVAGAVLFGFVVVGFLLVPEVPQESGSAPVLAERVSAVTDWVSLAMQLLAYVLLFTGTSSAWFAQMRLRK